MRHGFAETYARIHYYLATFHAVFHRVFHSLFKKCNYLGYDALVEGVDLHRFRDSQHVHQDERRAGLSRDPRHIGIEAKRAYIVYYVGAGFK